MRHGVDLPIGTFQRRHQERAAPKAFRVSNRRHGYVDHLPGFQKGRNGCRYGNRCDVLGLRGNAWWNRDAELVQHVLQALNRVLRLRDLVTRAIQADDQTVANKLVIPDPGNTCQILYALRFRHCRHQPQGHGEEPSGAMLHTRHSVSPAIRMANKGC